MLSRQLRASFGVLSILTISSCVAPGPTRESNDASPNEDVNDFGSVGHRDERLGVPSFVWFNRSAAPADSAATSPTQVAGLAIPSIAQAFGLTPDAAKNLALKDVDDHGKGPIIARFTQKINGIEIFRGGVNLVMTRAGAKVAATGLLAPTLRGADRPFTLATIDALTIGAERMGVHSTLSSISSSNGYERFSAPELSAPARVKRVFYPLRSDEFELEPAFFVELMMRSGAARGLVVSAIDGRVLLDHDLVHYDATPFTYRVYADPVTMLPTDGPQGSAMEPHPTGKPDHQTLVLGPPGTVSLVNFPFSKNDPWLSATATTTNGNNVSAYADINTPDGLSSGDPISTITAPGLFGNVADTSVSANATPVNIQAGITNLFYITNFLHDWFYDAGFDEKSGNPQSSNFGRGGADRDPILAEAQDFSGTNNSNAAVPPDGQSPRIQMYLFSGPTNASLTIAGGPAAGLKTVSTASGFGPDVFATTASVVLASDSAGDLADACEPLENDVTGKIVLIHRETCSFVQKATNAQAANAAGVIIANVATSVSPTVAPFMGGTQLGITIPILSVNLADGQAIEAALAAGGTTTATMNRADAIDLDGALDTSIVTHEWGHVLSNRLIGDGMGLTTNQSGGLGEGWSDFVALILTVRADDPGNFSGAYAEGAYATSGSGDDIYYGVRRVPYSIDFTKNALTLKDIQDGTPLPTGVATSFGEDGSSNSEVHNTGEIWASMLWECYASLLRDGGRSFGDTQELMKRYVVTSYKATPVDPTIIEARDAMLATVLANDDKDFQLFWKAFAKRGAGAGAIGPIKASPNNQGVTESFESGNAIEIDSAVLNDDIISCDHDGILDDEEVGSIEVTLRNAGSGALAATVASIVPKTLDVKLFDSDAITLPPLKPFESTKTKIKARISAIKHGIPIELDVNVTDPSLPDQHKTVVVAIPTHYDSDEAANSSSIDHVDTTKTAWKVTATGGTGEKWTRPLPLGTDGYWQVTDPAISADHRLTSPQFAIDDTTFSLTFKHKWQLKRSTRRNVDLDGGLIEVSTDIGKPWQDISTYGSIAYNTVVDTGGRNDNPLSGRKAYGNTSPGYPDNWVTSHIDVTLPAHPETVEIRFRVGAASGRGGADGWLVDDIQLDKIASTPFYSFVAHADACDPNGPTTVVGPSQTVLAKAHVTLSGTATSPTDKPLTIIWEQTAGPPVTLIDETTLTPSFDAFDTGQKEVVSFALRAHDGALLSPASRMDITVNPLDPKADEGCTCRTPSTTTRRGLSTPSALAVLGVIGAFIFRRRRRRAT